jgi:membrane protease YdiL (CAAX protease family)
VTSDSVPESKAFGPARGEGKDPGERVTSFRLLALMVGLIAGWGLLMQRFGGSGNIYAIMGPYALSVSAVIAALSSSDLRRWLRPTPLAIFSGLAVGAGMTLLTYPLFSLAQRVFPGLGSAVSALYSTAHRTSLSEALPWVLAIIVAEELLWRGALLHVLARRVPDALAMALSVLSYALAQFGTGSWIVMLLAVVCGTAWTFQRRLTHSLLSPLISHLIWTPVVILFHPVAPN